MNRAVFLDRDGVINRVNLREGRPFAPRSLDDLEFLPDVGQAIDAMRQAGFLMIIVTNQPDVASGITPLAVVEAMHGRIKDTFQIDDIKVCYHRDEDACSCRKPKPGMILEAEKDWTLDLSCSFLVGDRWRDIGAGRAAGCRTILIDGGYNEQKAKDPDAVVGSLLEASTLILTDRV